MADTPASAPRRRSRSQFYLFVEGNVSGPYTINDLLKMRDEKKVKLDTPCCLAGSSDWTTVEVVLTHKVGGRRWKRVKKPSLTSFSRRHLPSATFYAFGLTALVIGGWYFLERQNTMVGLLMMTAGFLLGILGFFLFPTRVRD